MELKESRMQKIEDSRLKQQTQRMQNMKDVFDQYLKMIKDLEFRNAQLQKEKEKYMFYQHLYHDLLNENKQLIENYQWINQQLNQYKLQTKNQQFALYEQKKQDTYPLVNFTVERERYEQLIIAFENLKKQFYVVSKENLQLKQIIRQSQVPKQRKRIDKRQIEDGQSILAENQIELIKIQLKKQEKLIKKYEHTERQQNHLIHLLKMKNESHTQKTPFPKS